jgi:hypothetical protein
MALINLTEFSINNSIEMNGKYNSPVIIMCYGELYWIYCME